MNRERRRDIQAQSNALAALLGESASSDWTATQASLEDCKGMIEGIRDEEQDYLDNMPESFQNSEKGEAAQGAIDALDEAIDALDAAIDAGETLQWNLISGQVESAIDALATASA